MMIELYLSSYTLELSNFQELKTSSIRTIDKCLKKELFIESRKSEIWFTKRHGTSHSEINKKKYHLSKGILTYNIHPTLKYCVVIMIKLVFIIIIQLKQK